MGKLGVSVCLLAIALCYAKAKSVAENRDGNLIYGLFPENFRWGFATASYQIEGGWADDGRYFELQRVLAHMDF